LQAPAARLPCSLASALPGTTIARRRERQTEEAKARTAEADVRLAEAFAHLIPIANGRDGTSHLSETAVSKLIEDVAGQVDDEELRRKMAPAVLPGRVGIASQVAALSAIAELILRHPEFLRTPGLAALEELKDLGVGYPKLEAAWNAAMERVAG